MHRRTANNLASIIIKILALFTVLLLLIILGYLIFRGLVSNTQKEKDVLVSSASPANVSIYVHKGTELKNIDWFTLQKMGQGTIKSLRIVSHVNESFNLYVDERVAVSFRSYTNLDENTTFKTGQGVNISEDEGGMIILPKGVAPPKNYNEILVQDKVLAVNQVVTALNGNQKIHALSETETKAVINGDIKNWSELGGPDLDLIFKENATPEEIKNNPGMVSEMDASVFSDSELSNLRITHLIRKANITWRYLTTNAEESGEYGGIADIILNTFIMIILVIILASPVGVGASVYLALYAKGKKAEIARRGIDLLSGIPSIIFGLFGMLVFVQFLGWGFSLISGSLTLSLMILPTIIRTSEEAIRAVDKNQVYASLGLGATKIETIFKIVIPTAKNGITTGIILGIGRALGETAALIFTIGSSTDLTRGLTSSTRVLAQHIYLTIIEGQSMDKAFASSLVLIVLELIINTGARKIMFKGQKNG